MLGTEPQNKCFIFSFCFQKDTTHMDTFYCGGLRERERLYGNPRDTAWPLVVSAWEATV